MKVDTSRLDKKIKEMEEFIKKVQDVERQTMAHLMKGSGAPGKGDEKDKLTYIG